MSPLLGLVAFDLVTIACGYALLVALGVARLRAGDARLLGLCYLAGWALLGTLLTVGLVLGVGPQVITVVVVAVLVVAACALVRRRWGAAAPDPSERGRHPLALAVAAAGGFALIVSSLAALVVSATSEWNPSSDWDAVWFWIPKAEAIYYSHGLDAGVWGTINHAEYPPLLPAMDAALFHFAGGVHPSLLPVQQTVLGVAFLAALLALIDRFVPRWLSLPSLAVLAAAPWYWQQMLSVMPDQAIAYLTAAAAVTGVIWVREGGLASLVLCFVFLAAATLTKLEGGFFAVLVLVVVLAAGLAVRRRAALPALALVLAPALVVLWRVWLSRHGLRSANPDYAVTDLLRPGFLADRTGRFTYAFHRMVATAYGFFDNSFGALRSPAGVLSSPFGWLDSLLGGRELLALLLPSLLFVAAVARRSSVLAAAAYAWVALAWLGLASIYWIGRPEVHWYVEVTIDRVEPTIMIVTVALSVLLLGLALGRGSEFTETGSERAR